MEIRCSTPKYRWTGAQDTALTDVSTAGDPAEYESCTIARSYLPTLAVSIPSLQYLALNVFGRYGEPWRHWLLFHPIEGRNYWWRFDASGGEKIATPIDGL